jgi:hypothetical protein
MPNLIFKSLISYSTFTDFALFWFIVPFFGLNVPFSGSLKSKYENRGLRPEIKDKLL